MSLDHRLSSDECDALEAALLDKAETAIGTKDFDGIHIAIEIMRQHRSASFQRRADRFNARRKGLRLTRSTP